MVPGLAEVLAGLPFAVSFAAARSTALVVPGRRRGALNEALHELRRPLQALALALPPEAEAGPAAESSLRLAVAALERLDREINGSPAVDEAAPLRLRPLVEAAAARWAPKASAHGGRVEVDWTAEEPIVHGDSVSLSQALDNLIINGIEHGGGDLIIRAGEEGAAATVAVRDRGTAREEWPVVAVAKGLGGPIGARRRGHGLRVVRRAAAEHGGRFRLLRSAAGTEAVLELPLWPPAGDARRAG